MADGRLTELVPEFLELNRRRLLGDPPLSVLELDRWSELRDWLAYEFGDAPAIGKPARELRVPTHLKVRFGGENSGSGTLENLSQGGVFVCCESPLPPGALVFIEIEADGVLPLQLEGRVAHSREHENLDGHAGFGVAFQDVPAEDLPALTRLIESALDRAATG